VLHNKRSHDNEKPTYSNEEYPPIAATREIPSPATKTQHSQEKRKRKKKILEWVAYPFSSGSS